MNTIEVVAELNREIANLKRARQLLAPTRRSTRNARGYKVTAAGREKIAAAQRKRWAKFHRERARA